MLHWILRKIVGSKNQRELKKLWPIVQQINRLEEELQQQPESVLQAKTAQWKKELAEIEDYSAVQAYLNKILPEAYAVVKNAARRLSGRPLTVCDQPMTWEMVHFDVQLIGGAALHHGKIAEMATGEGKTLVATLPLYLNGLTGRGVHLITVNDYLARRDAEWMGFLLKYLGITVGCIQHDQPPSIRREQYNCDVTYGTNAEFGFDYLRDNGLATSVDEQVQRGHWYAIVDEVDSVLIDEARTPLIISGPVAQDTHQYDKYKPMVERLVKEQTNLLTKFAQEAKELGDAGKFDEAGHVLFKMKIGQPRQRALMRLMEEPEYRRAVEKAELSYYNDPQKKALFALKEELYYTIDEKSHESDLMEMGRKFLSPDDPDAFVLPDLATAFADIEQNKSLSPEQKLAAKEEVQARMDVQAQRMHNISQLLRAYCLYEKDVNYMVGSIHKEGEQPGEPKVIILDEHTGRPMPGRRWSDGLHQAVEAKEGVRIDKETQTLATITIQNYFRLYKKLAGMTGTAETEASEFHDIYKLDMLIVPTNRPIVRTDNNDKIYKTRREKYNAVIELIKQRHEKGQPMLIGTASVDASETVSRMMRAAKIPHQVLNAKNHRAEAGIVAQAGQKGAITVSTNMAGRGTDIKLGPEVPALGGLLVIGTERHEARRIDRQLRGRCARQGDPGESMFYISFEDHLMMNFGAAGRMTSLMERFGLEDGQELEHPWLNRSVESAQKRVEQRNYVYRKRTLEFDDVLNKQRTVIYEFRNDALTVEDPHAMVLEVIDEAIPVKVAGFLEVEDGEPDYDGLLQWINVTFPLRLTREAAALESRDAKANAAWLTAKVKEAYEMKTGTEIPEALKGLERYVLLNAIDRLWQEHLYNIDSLRDGVHLRSFAQKDPLIEYKAEAYDLFEALMGNIKSEVLHNLFRSTTNLRAFEELLAGLPRKFSGGGSEDDPEIPAQARRPQGQPAQRPSLQMGGGGTITLSGGFMPQQKKPVLPQKPQQQQKPQQKQGGGQARIGG
jgi:preprotein translocase subunit SecA